MLKVTAAIGTIKRSPCRSRTEYAVIPREVSARRGHQDSKFGHEVLPFENDGAGSIAPRTLQPIEEAAIGQRRQTFRGYGGTGCIADQSFQADSVAGLNRNVRMYTETGNHGAAGALE